MADPRKNFSYGRISVAPSPASSGTTLSITNADATQFLDPATDGGAYNVTIWPANQIPLSSNSEILRVTAKGAANTGGSGHTQLTVVRTQEATIARTIQVGDQIAQTITKKTLDDLIPVTSEFGRSLIDDVDAAAARATLGLSGANVFTENVVISRDNTSGIMTAVLKDGTTYTHANDLLALINTVETNAPEPINIKIVPSNAPYPCGAATGTGSITKDTIIQGYGVKLLANTSHTGGAMFQISVDQKSLMVSGLEIDVNKYFGTAIGGGTGSGAYAPKLLYVKDVKIKNYYSFGIFANDLTGNATNDSTLIVENTYIDAGGTNALNECIETASMKNVIIRNVKAYSNKLTYCSGTNIYVDGFIGSCVGYTGTTDFHMQGGVVVVRNIDLTEALLLLRGYGDTEFNVPISQTKLLYIDGYNSKNTTQVPLRIDTIGDNAGGGDVTLGDIDQLVLKNLNIARGEIILDTYQNSYIKSHGKIAIVDIENVTIDTMTTNKSVLIDRNNDIDILRMRNVSPPAAIVGDSAASLVRLEVNRSSITVADLSVEQVIPAPTVNLMRVTDSNSGNTANVTISKTIANGLTAHNVTGTPVVNKTLTRGATPERRLSYNVRDYGAVPNAKTVADGAMTAASGVLTSATAAFSITDVGKSITVIGASTSGQTLRTTIASYQSATQVTLTANAVTTVSGASVLWGTDAKNFIAAALLEASLSTSAHKTVTIPAGKYYISGRLTPYSGVTIKGEGIGQTILYGGTTNDYVFYNATTNNITGFNIESMTIDVFNMYNASGVGIYYAQNCTFNKLELKNSPSGGWLAKLGVANGLTDNTLCENNKFIDCVFDGHAGSLEMLLLFNCKNTQVTRCLFKNKTTSGPGIGLWQKTYNTVIEDLVMNNCVGSGIYYSFTCEDTYIIRPIFDNVGTAVVGANRSDNGSFGEIQARGLQIISPILRGGANSTAGVGISFGATDRVIVANPEISGYAVGIRINQGNSVTQPFPATNWEVYGGKIYNNNPTNNFHIIHPGIELVAVSGMTSASMKGKIHDMQVYDDRRNSVNDAAISSGAAILTSSTAYFNVTDVGKAITVSGAGTSGGTLTTTILSYQSSTQVTLAANASTSVSGATATYGTVTQRYPLTFEGPGSPSTFTWRDVEIYDNDLRSDTTQNASSVALADGGLIDASVFIYRNRNYVAFSGHPTQNSAPISEGGTGGSTAASARSNLQVETLRTFNVKDYNALGNGKIVNDGAMSASSAVLTSATASFTSADVGKAVMVKGAGSGTVADGRVHNTTILSYQSATQVTLASNATNTISSARVVWGTDDQAAIQAALDAAANKGVVSFGNGVYVIPNKSIELKPGSAMVGSGADTTVLIGGGVNAYGNVQVISDLTIDSNNNYFYTGIYSKGVTKNFTRVKFRNWGKYGINCVNDTVASQGSKDVYIQFCDFDHNGLNQTGGGCVEIEANYNNINIIDNVFGNSTNNGCFMEVTVALGTADPGLTTNVNIGLNVERNRVLGSFAKSGYAVGKHIRFRNNDMATDYQISSGGREGSTVPSTWVTEDVEVSGNTWRTNPNNGLSSTLLFVTGYAAGDDSGTLRKVVVENNYFEDGYIKCQVALDSTLQDIFIRKNQFKDANSANIWFYSNNNNMTLDNLVIEDNTFKNWRSTLSGTWSAIQFTAFGSGKSISFARTSINRNIFGPARGTSTRAVYLQNSSSGTETGDVYYAGNDFNVYTVSQDSTGILKRGFKNNGVTTFDNGNITGAVTLNWSNGRIQKGTLTGNITPTLTGGTDFGDELILILAQDATGSRTVTWPSNFKKAGGNLTLSTAASAVDTVNIAWDGTNWREVSRSMGLA